MIIKLLLLNHTNDTNVSLKQLHFILLSSDKSTNIYHAIINHTKPNHLDGIVFNIT